MIRPAGTPAACGLGASRQQPCSTRGAASGSCGCNPAAPGSALVLSQAVGVGISADEEIKGFALFARAHSGAICTVQQVSLCLTDSVGSGPQRAGY